VVTVAIAITLIVAVQIFVAVAGSFFAGIVEDNAQNSGTDKCKLTQRLSECNAVTVILANHQQHAIGDLGSCQRITDFADRRQVKNQIVIVLTQLF